MSPTWTHLPWHDLRADQLYDVVKLRQDVFVVEQDCAYPDLDGRDPEALHLLGYDGATLVAYLRLFPPTPHGERRDAVIGRVIVAASHRGTGLGVRLMREGFEQVQLLWGPTPVFVSAQAHLRRFYRGLGYRVCGEGYDEDGIPHLPMRHPGPASVPSIPSMPRSS